MKLLCIFFAYVLLLRYANAGIAGLTKFFRHQFPGSWSVPQGSTSTESKGDSKTSEPLKVDNLCVDMNQVLHSGLKLATSGNKKLFVSKIFADLDNLLKVVEPTRALVLAFDGPAPFAKMQTQRNRRISSPDNSIITPGTNLMNSIEDIMVCYVVQRLRRANFQNLTIFISGPCVPGEGEMKIVEWVNNHMKGSDSLVISGSDSDILLQGLAIANRPGKAKRSKTLILQSGAGGSGKDRDGSGWQRQSAFCDVDRLADDLQKYTGMAPSSSQSTILRNQYANLPVNYGNESSPGNDNPINHTKRDDGSPVAKYANNVVVGGSFSDPGRPSSRGTFSLPSSFNLDLIVLFVLQGNDYLPKMRGVTLPKAAGAYGRAMLRLPPTQRSLLDLEHNTFNFLALWTIMDELGPWTAPIKAKKGKRDNEEANNNGNEGLWTKLDSDKATIPLPVTLPTPLQSFHTFLQRKRSQDFEKSITRNNERSKNGSKGSTLNPEWIDYSNDPAYNVEKGLAFPYGSVVHPSGEGPLAFAKHPSENITEMKQKSGSGNMAYKLWGTSVEVDGVTFACEPIHSNKKLARQEVSALALRALDPDMYAEMLVQREVARTKLFKMRRAVMSEEGKFLDEHFPGILREGALQEEEEEDERGLTDGPESRQSPQPAAHEEKGGQDGNYDPEDDIEGPGVGSRGRAASETQNYEGEAISAESDTYGQEQEQEQEGDSLYVSEQGYTRFVTDADVEAYLKGLLWVVQMYVEGVCPDLSYTFVNRPPASPACVQKYIEKKYLQARAEDLKSRGKRYDPFIRPVSKGKNGEGRVRWGRATKGNKSGAPDKGHRGGDNTTHPGQWTQLISGIGDLLDLVEPSDLLHPGMGLLTGSRAHTLLRKCLHTPHSSAQPLSAYGACVCVVPWSGESHVPPHLLPIWRAMQVKYFDKFGEGRLMDATYEEVVHEMSLIFETAKVITDVTHGSTDINGDRDSDDDGIIGAGREQAMSTENTMNALSGAPIDRKEEVMEKEGDASSLKQGIFSTISNHTVSVGHEHSFWTVIAPGSERGMRGRGFRASYFPHFKRLSAFSTSVPFFMPKRIPFGHRLMITDQQLSSRKTKFKKYGRESQPDKSNKPGKPSKSGKPSKLGKPGKGPQLSKVPDRAIARDGKPSPIPKKGESHKKVSKTSNFSGNNDDQRTLRALPGLSGLPSENPETPAPGTWSIFTADGRKEGK